MDATNHPCYRDDSDHLGFINFGIFLKARRGFTFWSSTNNRGVFSQPTRSELSRAMHLRFTHRGVFFAKVLVQKVPPTRAR